MMGRKAPVPRRGLTIFPCAMDAANRFSNGTVLRQASSAPESPLQFRAKATLAVLLVGSSGEKSAAWAESMLRSVS